MVKVADFGLGNTVSDSDETVTSPVGTPLFSAPEILCPHAYSVREGFDFQLVPTVVSIAALRAAHAYCLLACYHHRKVTTTVNLRTSGAWVSFCTTWWWASCRFR